MKKMPGPYEHACRLCGRRFVGMSNKWYCDECRHNVPCAVCGKVIDPGPTQFTRYVKRGYLTCGRRECKNELQSRIWAEKRSL